MVTINGDLQQFTGTKKMADTWNGFAAMATINSKFVPETMTSVIQIRMGSQHRMFGGKCRTCLQAAGSCCCPATKQWTDFNKF